MGKFTSSCMDPDSPITERDLKKVFWRQFPIHGSVNYERMQAMGFLFAILPVLKKLWPDKKDLAKAMRRHMENYNCTLAMSPFIMGLVLSMEEKCAADPENTDVDAIGRLKTALMGPLSGIGDNFFWGIFRVIAAGIGVSFALKGSILGPLLFVLLFNIPNIAVRWFGLFAGYKYGTSLVDRVNSSGLMGLVSYCTGIVVVCIIGAMIALNFDITTPLVVNWGQTQLAFQQIFDQILPGLLPMAFTMGFFFALRKNMKANTLMLLAVIIGFVLGAAGLI